MKTYAFIVKHWNFYFQTFGYAIVSLLFIVARGNLMFQAISTCAGCCW